MAEGERLMWRLCSLILRVPSRCGGVPIDFVDRSTVSTGAKRDTRQYARKVSTRNGAHQQGVTQDTLSFALRVIASAMIESRSRSPSNKKGALYENPFFILAESEGFEPSDGFPSTVFKPAKRTLI
jgi:hypothetical protein